MIETYLRIAATGLIFLLPSAILGVLANSLDIGEAEVLFAILCVLSVFVAIVGFIGAGLCAVWGIA